MLDNVPFGRFQLLERIEQTAQFGADICEEIGCLHDGHLLGLDEVLVDRSGVGEVGAISE